MMKYARQTVLWLCPQVWTDFCPIVQMIQFRLFPAYSLEFAFMLCFFVIFCQWVLSSLRHPWFALTWKKKSDWPDFSMNVCPSSWKGLKSSLQGLLLYVAKWKKSFQQAQAHKSESSAIFLSIWHQHYLTKRHRLISFSQPFHKKMLSLRCQELPCCCTHSRLDKKSCNSECHKWDVQIHFWPLVAKR